MQSVFKIKRTYRPAANISGRLAVLMAAVFFLVNLPGLSAGQQIGATDESTITIESAPDMEVISFAKTVIVKQQAKGVLVFGADVVIEGRVDGDVAAIGGSVTQRDGSYIGGDVIVVGGKYVPESLKPLRGENKQTIIFAAYESELRELAQNPAKLFAPSFTVAFVALRAVSVLFWFVVTMVFVTIAPGAVGRAVTRFRLSPGKVVGFGLFSLIASFILGAVGLSYLPSYLHPIVLVAVILVLAPIYMFGRVALNVAFGQLIQRRFLPESSSSETFAILLGILGWTLLLFIPYVWPFAFLALFSAGLGLVLTARPGTPWSTR